MNWDEAVAVGAQAYIDLIDRWMQNEANCGKEDIAAAVLAAAGWRPEHVIKAEALRAAAAGFVDWDVVYGHEEKTPEYEASMATAEYLSRLADQLDGR